MKYIKLVSLTLIMILMNVNSNANRFEIISAKMSISYRLLLSYEATNRVVEIKSDEEKFSELKKCMAGEGDKKSCIFNKKFPIDVYCLISKKCNTSLYYIEQITLNISIKCTRDPLELVNYNIYL